MNHDLAEVLANPLRFAAEKYRHAMANPRAVPAKTLGYAKYDLVRVMNADSTPRVARLGGRELLARTLAVPAARFFRMRRSVSLLVAAGDAGDARHRRGHLPEPDPGAVAEGAAIESRGGREPGGTQ